MTVHHVICFGMGKCGTTLLHETLRTSSIFRVPVEKKEHNYFRYPDVFVRDDYLAPFLNLGEPPSVLDNLVTFEASPSYASSGGITRVAPRLTTISKELSDCAFVFCVRNPVARIFSQYVHDLQDFCRFGPFGYGPTIFWADFFQNIYNQDLLNAIPSQAILHLSYAELLRCALDAVGPERVLLFVLERDATAYPGFYDRLCNLVRRPNDGAWEDRQPGVVLPGGRVPDYLYTGLTGMTVTVEEQSIKVPPRQFIIACDRGDEWLGDVAPVDAAYAIECARRWTDSLSFELFHELDERYRADVESFFALAEKHFPGEGNLRRYFNRELAPILVGRAVPTDDTWRSIVAEAKE